MAPIRSVRLGFLWLTAATTLLGQDALPVFTVNPRSQSASPGANINFKVAVSPSSGTSLQWQHDGVDVAEAATPVLLLANVSMSSAGSYWAVAINGGGSVTSKVATLGIDPTFTKITAGPVATDGGDSSGAAWGDFNNDGFPDLFVGNGGTKNFLYRNNGDGSFARLTAAAPALDSGYGGSWGDFDNDGWLDLFVANRSANQLYHNNGNGTFTKVTGFAGAAGATSWSGSWADYDRDGWLDLFISNGGGNNNALLHNTAHGGFTRVLDGRIVKDGGVSIGSAWQDYDGDGWPDLYVANNSSATSFLYHNLRDQSFERVTAGRIARDTQSAIVPDWGDYDNDGRPDLAVAVFGHCLLYRNLGNGDFERQMTGPVVTDTQNSEILLWGDYDNDGFLDLFSANDGGQNNSLYHNNGNGTFTKITAGSPVNDGGNSAGAAWTDYNNDGFLDLFVANWHGSGPNFLYRNNTNANHWLKVVCIGSASNRAGIGARVHVTARLHEELTTQLREISGGTGFGQSDQLAHFGLADALEVESMRIDWPSGAIQTLGPLPTNQKIVIREPPRIREIRRAETGWRIEFLGAPQQGYRIETGDNLRQWSQAGVAEELPAPGLFEATISADESAPSLLFRVVEP